MRGVKLVPCRNNFTILSLNAFRKFHDFFLNSLESGSAGESLIQNSPRNLMDFEEFEPSPLLANASATASWTLVQSRQGSIGVTVNFI